MKEEKMIQYLKDANLWGENNTYFFAMAPQSFSNEESIFGFDRLSTKYYIINKNEEGIGIIPFYETLKSIKELITRIPHSEIKEVNIEDYKFLFILKGTKVIIKTTENKVFEFDYPSKKSQKFLESNMYKFVSEYIK